MKPLIGSQRENPRPMDPRFPDLAGPMTKQFDNELARRDRGLKLFGARTYRDEWPWQGRKGWRGLDERVGADGTQNAAGLQQLFGRREVPFRAPPPAQLAQRLQCDPPARRSSGMTLFEKIIARQIPAKIAYEDEQIIVVHDVAPQAPVHLLVIPKKCIPTLNDVTDADRELVGTLFTTASKVMRQLGHADYRTCFNCGAGAQQTVFHLHLHVLAGRAFTWPPG